MKPRNIDERMLIPNTTQVPNVVIDWMMAELGGPAFKVLMFFIRQRYGFQMPYGKFQYSIGEICDGITIMMRGEDGEKKVKRVCAGTGLTRESVVSAVRELNKMAALEVHSSGNRRKMNVYELGDFKVFEKSEIRPASSRESDHGEVGNPTNSKSEIRLQPSRKAERLNRNQGETKEKPIQEGEDAAPTGVHQIEGPKPPSLFGNLVSIRKQMGTLPMPPVKGENGKPRYSRDHSDLFGHVARLECENIEKMDGIDAATEVFSFAAKDKWHGKNPIIPAKYIQYKTAYLAEHGGIGETPDDVNRRVAERIEKKNRERGQ